ncbi:MAG: ABC transporter substrate-binding protein [Lachnospiraceae bacterium]|nr:ABC transporter substrate-binding protein [Lachnospiraceae bacterium]
MKKRAFTAVLAVVLAAGILAGCGSSGSEGSTATSSSGDTSAAASGKGDMVTLNLYIPTLATYSEDAIDDVQNAISDYTAEKYGWKVALNYTEIGNFEQKINLAMTTDDLDVTCYFTDSGQLANYAHNNQLLDITDYFANASDDLKNTFTDAEIQATTLDGKMYGLVRKYQYGGAECVVMNKDIVDELGIDPSTITDMDSLEKVLYEVHEKYPDIYAIVPQSSSDMTWIDPFVKGIGLTSYAYTEYTPEMDATTLKSVFDTDSLKEFCSYTHKWYQDGLVMQDAVSNTQEGSDMVTSGAAFCCFHNFDIDPLEDIYPNTVCSPALTVAFAGPTDIGNLQYGISSNSSHPDESFELLSALYTDAKLETFLAYGIEGEHYVIGEDGKADYPEGMTAENEPYGGFSATAVYPNYLILPVKESATVDDYEKAVDDWNNSVKVSPTMGFYFDTADFTDFVTAYQNIEDKYLNALETGSIGYDDVIDQIHDELSDIGFDDVLEKTQTQLDSFLQGES